MRMRSVDPLPNIVELRPLIQYAAEKDKLTGHSWQVLAYILAHLLSSITQFLAFLYMAHSLYTVSNFANTL